MALPSPSKLLSLSPFSVPTEPALSTRPAAVRPDYQVHPGVLVVLRTVGRQSLVVRSLRLQRCLGSTVLSAVIYLAPLALASPTFIYIRVIRCVLVPFGAVLGLRVPRGEPFASKNVGPCRDSSEVHRIYATSVHTRWATWAGSAPIVAFVVHLTMVWFATLLRESLNQRFVQVSVRRSVVVFGDRVLTVALFIDIPNPIPASVVLAFNPSPELQWKPSISEASRHWLDHIMPVRAG